jgi:hypothetical protein
VMVELDSVLDTIFAAVSTLTPYPSPQGRGEMPSRVH